VCVCVCVYIYVCIGFSFTKTSPPPLDRAEKVKTILESTLYILIFIVNALGH
jgi:hypothetical protein